MNRSITRVLTLALLATVATAQTCSPTQPSGIVQPITQCVFGEYDFTPLSQVDLYGVFNSRQYVYRMCGSVQDSLCPANTSACAFSNDRSVCDVAGSATSLVSTTNTFHRMSYIGNVPSMGVSITAITPGPFCSSGQNHTVITNIYCSGPNVPRRLESLSKIDVGCLCQTTISLYSSLACPRSMNVTAPVAPVTTYPPTALPCTLGQFGVDLRSQFANDIHFYSAVRGERYVLNLCGPVQDIGCARAAGTASSACAVPRCLNDSAIALMFRHQTPTWGYTNAVNNSNGYTMVNYNDLNNVLVIRLTCDPNATQAIIVQVNMPASGIREFIMRSSLACVNESALVLAAPQCTSGCCGMGTDFSALKNVEVTGYTDSGRGMPWTFAMCGSIRGDCNGAMACSKPGCPMGGSGSHALSYWQGQDQSIYWSYVNGLDFTGGLRMITTNGEVCDHAPSRTIVTYRCDPLAFVPRASDVVEFPSCTYQITIYTTSVCATPRYLGGAANIGNRNTTASSVVVAPAKSVFGCQFAGYDFSALASNDFEARIWPYIFHTRICGAQTNPLCGSGGNQDTSICQVPYSDCGNSPGAQWIVSLWNPYLAQWGFVGNDWKNGVSQRMMTGDLCDGGVPRSIVYNFVCDPAAVIPYQDQGFESPGSYICNYFMRIRTNIVCTPPPNEQIGNGNWTMESSSTGSKWSYQKFNSGFAIHSTFHWISIVTVVLVGLM